LRFSAAVGGLILILGLVLTAAGFATVNFFIRSCNCTAQAEELRSSLNLTNLALVPSGRLLRQPATAHPGIDLRYGPILPPIPTDPATLMITSARDLRP